MLIDVVRGIPGSDELWPHMQDRVEDRARRYAAIQERMISPEGTFPVVGRSIVYRCGAFHLLSQAALLGLLPEGLRSAEVRCALTAVIRRTMEAAGTFDEAGWLKHGLAGYQPGLAESYISTGSPYLCLTGLVAVGLSPDAPFWADPPADWTNRRVWAGQDTSADHALRSARIRRE